MAKAYAILCLRQNEINDLQKSTKQNPHEFAPHGGFYPLTARRLQPLRWEMNCVCYLLDRASWL